MPTAPQKFCEQCLRETTARGECDRHPYSRQLSMSQPGDREHYLVMRRLQWGRRVPWLFLAGYLLVTFSIGGLYFSFGSHQAHIGYLVESFIFANFFIIAAILLSSPILVSLWFFGVLSRDLLLGIRRRIRGIQIDDVPDMLTTPIDDPNPVLSAEKARVVRQTHREARAKVGYARFLR